MLGSEDCKVHGFNARVITGIAMAGGFYPGLGIILFACLTNSLPGQDLLKQFMGWLLFSYIGFFVGGLLALICGTIVLHSTQAVARYFGICDQQIPVAAFSGGLSALVAHATLLLPINPQLEGLKHQFAIPMLMLATMIAQYCASSAARAALISADYEIHYPAKISIPKFTVKQMLVTTSAVGLSMGCLSFLNLPHLKILSLTLAWFCLQSVSLIAITARSSRPVTSALLAKDYNVPRETVS